MNSSVIFLIVAAMLAIAMVVGTFRSPRVPGQRAFFLSGLAALWWIAAVLLRFNTPDLDWKIFYCELAWFGIMAAPLYWSLGFLTYAGGRRMEKTGNLLLIGLLSGLVGGVALTNDWHQWLYTGVTNVERPSFSHGWFFYAVLGIVYAAMASSGVAVLINGMRRVRRHRLQFVSLIAAMSLPWIANVAFVFFQFRIFNDDPTPFAFALTAVLILMAQAFGKLFQAPPIARDIIFKVLPDPVIVFDNRKRILELNPAAESLPGLPGRRVGEVLADTHPLAALAGTSPSGGGRTQMVEFSEIGKSYEVSSQAVKPWGRPAGTMLVLRDVTARKAAEDGLAAMSRDLQSRLEENIRLHNLLKEEAARDHLTGLHNRRHANEILPAILGQAAPGKEAAVIILDIDNFKQVNDQFGHAAGDEVLKVFAAMLENQLEPGEHAFRYGGEEFLVVMPGTSPEQATERCASWRKWIGNQRLDAIGHSQLTFSAGIAFCPQAGTALESATKAADVALYRAKISGRNRDVLWGDLLAGLEPPHRPESESRIVEQRKSTA